MENVILDIVVLPTYNVYNMAVVDASSYPDNYSIANPTLEISLPGGLGVVYKEFEARQTNIFNSNDLGLTEDKPYVIPDGIYHLKYTISPANENYVEKSIMRVDKLQEKFDMAFMKLDMMECDKAIKKQTKVEFNTIYFLIQGAIAAANNCANKQAQKLYDVASRMLDGRCDNESINYIINFK